MTRNFAPPPPSDDEIRAIVTSQLGIEPRYMERLRSGAWSSVIAFQAINTSMVIRFSATSDDFRCDQLASAFANADLPVPKVYAIGSHESRWWCISERVPGRHLDELDSEGMERILPSLARTLRALKDVDSSNTVGFGGWDEHGNGRFKSFADQLLDVAVDRPEERGGGWTETLAAHPEVRRVFEDGVTEMKRLTPRLSTKRQLIHQDTINYNVVVDNDVVSGVFDWGCAMWGDAIYDLAWFRFWEPWYPQWSELKVSEYLAREVGIEGEDMADRMRCCLLHIGVGHIRYNAFINNQQSMHEVAAATSTLLQRSLP